MTLAHDSLIRDLTALADKGEVDPVYGRDPEMYAILEILARRRSSNVILVGHDGVGKNRIVEGLAALGVEGSDNHLDTYRILSLSLGPLLLGTKGLEQELIKLLGFLRTTKGNVLYIDEIETVLANENPEDLRVDFCSILRSPINRGEITCIGTTTPRNWRRIRETDPAIADRFEVLSIEPMTEVSAHEVLTNVRPLIQEHHSVSIRDDALREAIQLTELFNPEEYLPGKAIDAIDQACARFRLKRSAKENQADVISQSSMVLLGTEVSPHDVRRAISKAAKVPFSRLQLLDQWSDVERKLRKGAIGQDVSISRLIARLKKCFGSLSSSYRPKAILLFAGRTSTGKRFLAERLAKQLYGDDLPELRFKLNKFRPSDLAESLTLECDGEPDSRGEEPRSDAPRFPSRVIVLEHGEDDGPVSVSEALLNLLHDGRFTYSSGRVGYLKNSVVVITCAKKADVLERGQARKTYQRYREKLDKAVTSDLAACLDDVIPFYPLQDKHYLEIVRSYIRIFRTELATAGVALKLHKTAYDTLIVPKIKNGKGVPAVLKNLKSDLIRPIRSMVADGKTKKGMTIRVRAADDNLVISCETRESRV